MSELLIPVYLFTGFLEAGKTTFMTEQMKNPDFNYGEKTLMLICEQGEVEYHEKEDCFRNCLFEYVESEEDLTKEYLRQLASKYPDIEQVFVEYNGMWQITTFEQNCPDVWLIYQILTIADSTSFTAYNTMFRNLMYEKLSRSEAIILTRCDEDTDTETIHKICRGSNRRIIINYMMQDGQLMLDDIVDPLPFNVHANEITIGFEDYAIWISDVGDDIEKYHGKEITVTVYAVENEVLKKRGFFIGRDVMTCCIQDIQFMGFACINETGKKVKLPGWYTVTGTFSYEYVPEISKKFPVIHGYRIIDAPTPSDPIATFY